ncbi:MAG: helix-turn-helix transcriptional regulator [Fibrobacter sp.]|jgi:AraC-like DNA-binding protein|nr:helix-turn-helix transcriptional regulator [Fibrobacter sp.]
MFPTKTELLSQFKNPVYTTHTKFPFLQTFSCLQSWKNRPIIELEKLKIEILGIDFLEYSGVEKIDTQLRFQQDCFRLWYQLDGIGILQNVTRQNFGTARPGLLGIMDLGERHNYLHQKGNLECFQLLFSLLPSQHAKCYWNSEIEGKIVLENHERSYFESLIFDLLLVIDRKKEILGLATISRILEILVVLFKKGVLIIEESQFPKNKAKSLVAKAKQFMDLHYSDMEHQLELEKECGVDINYLNIIFKKETGFTLYQYICLVRMEHAKYLLETTQNSISDISNAVGYPNSNSFTRAFKRHANMTPQDFRQNYLHQNNKLC